MADASESRYGYEPTRSVCIIFVVIFSITTLAHTWQATRSRAWWLIPTVVIAALAEVLGWTARVMSSYDALNRTTYILQATVLVLAPTPFVAALFMGFGRVATRLGSEYSRLSPTMYSRVFLTIDIVSLFVQGAGGGMAASGNDDADKVKLGTNIILGGLILQITSMTIFCILMAEYVWRRSVQRPFHKSVEQEQFGMDRHMKMLIAGMCVSTFFVYIRCVYRIIEFADGFNGTIAHNQVLFNVFDGMMMTLALYTLNFMHPGQLLKTTAEKSEAPQYPMAERGSC